MDREHLKLVNRYIESQERLHYDQDGLTVVSEQNLGKLVEEIRRDRANNEAHRLANRDYVSVARIPQVIVDKWIADGFDFYKATAKQITEKLRVENLQAFLTHGGRF